LPTTVRNPAESSLNARIKKGAARGCSFQPGNAICQTK
jgi:hypothetical protein